MAGNMFGLSCPKCGRSDRIDICADVWVRLTRDGTDADQSRCGDHMWGDDSTALCTECHWAGPVKELVETGEDAE